MHDVTHLPPITEQRDFLIPQCRAHKMGNPALLFRAHLMRRSEEHTSELQSLMRISYAVFCLKQKNKQQHTNPASQLIPPNTSLVHVNTKTRSTIAITKT